MKIDFFLMGRKGIAVLQWVCASRYKPCVRHVVTAGDAGMEEDCVAGIEEICRSNGIAFSERNDYRPENTGYRIMVGWKWMVDPANTIVLHDSLLPAYRGFAPLVNALINGEQEIGATALWAAETYDSGPVITQKKISIQAPLRIGDAIDIMAGLYIDLLTGLLAQLEAGEEPAATAQDENMATYSLWRDEEDYSINWNDDSHRIERTILALAFPYKGACTLLNSEKIIIEDAVAVRDVAIVNRDAGKVIFTEEGLPVIVCGKGLLKIKTAYYYAGKASIFPLKKFRIRFGV